MDDKTNQIVFNLMQNVVDKLDEILAKIEVDKNIKPESNSLAKLPNEIDKLLMQQDNILNKIDASNREFTNALISNKGTNEIRNYEYVLFGKDSPLNTRFLIYIIAFVVISWSGIKYLPHYFLTQSELKKEKDNYQLFYNYLNLKQVESKKDGSQKLEVIFNKIKKRDNQLLEEYSSLLTKYQKEIRKQELEIELKKLQ